MTFAQLGLLPPLLQALDALGYQAPTPVQAQAIPAVLAGRDLMAVAQTGTGKTAAFALPLLQRLSADSRPVASNSARALILVPTRELAEQLHDSLRAYGQHLSQRTCAVYGGVSINPQMMAMRKGMDVVVATPGRLLDLHRQNAIRFGQVQALVLDEADRMLDLGFAAELNALLGALPRRRQTLLFSATSPAPIAAMAKAVLHNPLRVEITPPGTAARNIEQRVIPVDKKRKTALLNRLLATRKWGQGQVLVFVRTRKGVEQLVDALQARGLSCDSIHGDKPQPARLRALERFKTGEVQILVATDVAARGLDIDALPVVINFDLPLVAEDYVHRIGRTGRAGAKGLAISLVCADEVGQLAAIETLVKRVFERFEEEGFEPEHRVPFTNTVGQVLKKPKKPKKPKTFVTPPKIAAKAAPKRARPAPSGGRPGGRAAASKPATKARSR